MSITDELRKWAKGSTLSSWTAEHLTAIADRIDAEHKKACDDAWDNGYEADYLGIEKWLTEHPQVMEHHGWIRLPNDADGEPIHVGDEVEEIDCDGGHRVVELRMCESGWWVTAGGICRRSYKYRHYHAPTVEDVLTEFAYGLGVPVADSYVAATAAKLRLAEGEDA